MPVTALLETDVVVQADSGQVRDLLASQAGHPPVATRVHQSEVRRIDGRASSPQKGAQCGRAVHDDIMMLAVVRRPIRMPVAPMLRRGSGAHVEVGGPSVQARGMPFLVGPYSISSRRSSRTR